VLRDGPAHLARIGAADVPRRDRPLPTARMSHRAAVGRSVVSSGGTAAMAARMASTNARADCAVSSTATRGYDVSFTCPSPTRCRRPSPTPTSPPPWRPSTPRRWGAPSAGWSAFAKRGASIEALLTDLGLDPGEASRAVQRVAEQRTLGAKTEAVAAPDATLRELWRAEARAGGWDRGRSPAECSPAAGRTGRTGRTGEGIRTTVRPPPARKASPRWRGRPGKRAPAGRPGPRPAARAPGTPPAPPAQPRDWGPLPVESLQGSRTHRTEGV